MSLQFLLLISYKQPKRIIPMWDVLECDFCALSKVSGMGVNGSETPHDLSRGFDRLSATRMLRNVAVAHRFSVLGG